MYSPPLSAKMPPSTRASQALLFQRRCRHPPIPSPTAISIRTHSSSRYSPSTFNKPVEAPQNITPFPTENPKWIMRWNRPFDDAKDRDNSPRIRPPSGNATPYKAPWHHTRATPVTIVKRDKRSLFRYWFWKKVGFPYADQTPPLAPPFNVQSNPFRAQTRWPPDMQKLHPKQQFHFEKTYRRRAKLKWARPVWNRWTKVIRDSLIAMMLIYCVFIYVPDHGQGTPFDGLRVWFFNKMKKLIGLNDESVAEYERLQAKAREDAEPIITPWQYFWMDKEDRMPFQKWLRSLGTWNEPEGDDEVDDEEEIEAEIRASKEGAK